MIRKAKMPKSRKLYKKSCQNPKGKKFFLTLHRLFSPIIGALTNCKTMTFEEIRKDIKARKYKPIYFRVMQSTGR